MANIQIQPLVERLSDEEIEELAEALDGAGAPRLPNSFDGASLTIAEDVDDDVFAEMLDRLEALDAACEVYLPMEVDGRLDVGDFRVGSVASLVDALEELREELAPDEDEDEDEEDEDDDLDEEDERAEAMRRIWKLLRDATAEAMDRNLPLHIVT